MTLDVICDIIYLKEDVCDIFLEVQTMNNNENIINQNPYNIEPSNNNEPTVKQLIYKGMIILEKFVDWLNKIVDNNSDDNS